MNEACQAFAPSKFGKQTQSQIWAALLILDITCIRTTSKIDIHRTLRHDAPDRGDTCQRPTKAKMACAVAKVMATYELLEMVLLALPPRTAFFVQAVSRTWNTVIATSPAIQKLLFRRPSKALTPYTFKPSLVATVPCYAKELEFNKIIKPRLQDDRWKGTNTTLTTYRFCLHKNASQATRTSDSRTDLFWTSPPCTTALMRTRVARKDNKGNDSAQPDFLNCSVWHPEGLKFSELTSVAISMAEGLECYHVGDKIYVDVYCGTPVSKVITGGK